MVRLTALFALVALVLPALAMEATCSNAAPGAVALCEQQRAEVALNVLSERYARVWAQLPAERRGAFASAERRWLNGGRWDDHAACVAANGNVAAADVVGPRCLADVTTAHLETLNTALNVRVAGPQN
jgi:hypothetical protein